MTMTIVVPDDLAAEVERMVSDRAFHSPEAAVHDALRRLTDMRDQQRLVKSIYEANRSIEEGHGIPWSETLRDEIRASARAKMAAGHKPNPDVLPR